VEMPRMVQTVGERTDPPKGPERTGQPIFHHIAVHKVRAESRHLT
jgi:hypothetical protein